VTVPSQVLRPGGGQRDEPATSRRAMTRDEEKALAEAVLRTRHWTFRQAYPEILGAVRQIVSGHDRRREELSLDEVERISI